MTRNKLSKKFKASPNKEKWNCICPPNEYRVLDQSEAISLGIIPARIKNKINSVIVGASGSLENTIMYFANYCRIDNDFIDQEPYIELYESGSITPSLNGILHHADFIGRSTKLNQHELQIISASGSSADIKFIAKPAKKEGTLEELKSEGKLEGFNYSWNQGINKK